MSIQLLIELQHVFEIHSLIPLGIMLISLDLALNLKLSPNQPALERIFSIAQTKVQSTHLSTVRPRFAYQQGSQYLSGLGIGLLLLSFIIQSQ